MYVWVNASPRSPSSAAPCDNGQGTAGVRRSIFSPDGVSQRGRVSSWEDKGGRIQESGYRVLDGRLT